jgi:hypothetical protein
MGKTIEVNKSLSRSQVDNEIERITAKQRKFNLRKYLGKVRFRHMEPLQYQKKLRDEWE